MTPHISAKKGEIADIVFLPGDPLRAKFIAENYLDECRLVSSVRNIYFYTGSYKGRKITVGSSGMGFGSMGIYAYELFHFYGVKKIIRLGSCGSYSKDLHVRDLVLVEASFTDSGEFGMELMGKDISEYRPDFGLNRELEDSSIKLGKKIHKGAIHSTNVFYGCHSLEETLRKFKSVIAVEMESGALFACAMRTHGKAACLLTVSDSLVTHQELTPEERETTFKDMIGVALGIL